MQWRWQWWPGGSGTSTGRVGAAGAGKRVLERLREMQAMTESVTEDGNNLVATEDVSSGSSISPSWSTRCSSSSAASNETQRILQSLGVSFLLPP